MISLKVYLISISTFVLLLLSCNNSKTKVEYYPNSKMIKEKLYYPNKNNDSTFYFIDYFKNGNVDSEGWIKDYKREGKWLKYYSDGDVHYPIFFQNGIPNYVHPERKKPQIILSDSLRVGVPVYIKVINLYPDESFISDGNIDLKAVDDELPYDYIITPLSKGTISFGSERLIPVGINYLCLNILLQKKFIPTNQKKLNLIRLYKREKFDFAKITIH